MPPDSLCPKSKFVQGGTNAKPDNVGRKAEKPTAFHIFDGRILKIDRI